MTGSHHVDHNQPADQQQGNATREFLRLFARHVAARLIRTSADSRHSRGGTKRKRNAGRPGANGVDDTAG